MKKKITALILAASLLTSSAAFAEIDSTVKDSDGNVTVSIELPAECHNKNYSLFVFNPGMDENDMKADVTNRAAVQYFYQGYYADSAQTVSFKINKKNVDAQKTPHYKVLVTAGNYSESSVFSFYSDDEKNALISRVNSMSGTESDAGEIADSIIDMYNLQNFELYKTVGDNKAVAKKLADILKSGKKATNSNISDMIKEASLLAAVAQEGFELVSDRELLYNDIIKADSAFEDIIKDISDEGISAFNKTVCGKDYQTVEKLSEAVSKTLTVKDIYMHSQRGFGHVNSIIEKLGDYLAGQGFNKSAYNSSNKSVVAQKLIEAKELEFDKMIEKLNSLSKENTAANENQRPTTSGGSGGSGSSTSGLVAGNNKNEPTVPDKKDDGFGDISDAPWAKNYIERLAKLNVVSGKEDGNFYPNSSITRAEFVKIIVDALGFEAVGEVSFADVSPNDWYYSYVQRGASNGIIVGDEGNFRPNDNIRREDICAIAQRALLKKGVELADNGSEPSFSDVDNISAYAYTSVKLLSGNGIVRGNENNEFLPKNSATRAEAAVIICGILDAFSNPPKAAAVNAGEGATVDDKVISNLVRSGVVSVDSVVSSKRNVTKGEFAKILLVYAGKQNMTSENVGEKFYDDVDASTEYAPYINLAASLGYLKKGGDYKPNEIVTGEQVVAGMVNVLGYGGMISKESDYLKIASDVGITSGIDFSLSKTMTMEDIIKLFNNSLDAEVMTVEMTGGTAKLVKNGTFLKAFHDIETTKGIMNANNITAFATTSAPLKDTVLVDSVRYNLPDSLSYMNDYIGYYLEVNYREERNGELTIVNFEPIRTEELVLSENQISGFEGGRLSYLENANSSKEKSVKIEDGAVVIYNGVVVPNYDDSIFNLESGSMELIDARGEGYNLVKIYDYDTVVANGVSESNERIYSRLDGRTYNFEDYEHVLIRDKSGKEIKLSDIKEGNILSIAESKSKELVIITKSDTVVNGVLERIDRDEKICTIDGKEYDYIDNGILTSDYLRTTAAFYLDYKGKVAFADYGVNNAWSYGYLIKAVYDDGEGAAVIKMLMADGKVKTFVQLDAVNIDGEDAAAEKVIDLLSYNAEGIKQEAANPQLIRYRASSDGVLTRIDTARKGASENDSSLTLDANVTNRKYASVTGRLVENNGIGNVNNNMRLSDSTVIFMVPKSTEIQAAEDKKFELVTKSSISNEKTFAGPIYAYNINYENGDEIGALVIEKSGAADARIDLFSQTFITSVNTKANDDGETVTTYSGIKLDTGAEVELESYEDEDVLAPYNRGDIISYGLNGDGKVANVNTIVDYGTTAVGTVISPNDGSNWNGYTGMPRVMSAYGIFTYKNGNYVSFARSIDYENKQLVRGNMTYDISTATGYKYKTSTGKLEKMDIQEIGDYLYTVNPNATAFIYTSATQLKAVIIYADK